MLALAGFFEGLLEQGEESGEWHCGFLDHILSSGTIKED